MTSLTPQAIAQLNEQADHVLTVDLAQAQELAEKAYAAALASGHEAEQVTATILRGYGAFYQRHFTEAENLFVQAHDLASRLGSPLLAGRALSGMAVSTFRLGNFSQALGWYLEALKLHQQAGDIEGRARTLNHIGTLYADLGQPEQALRYRREAYSAALHSPRTLLIMLTALNLGSDLHCLGEYTQALELNRLSLQRAQEGGLERYRGMLLINIGTNLFELGRYEEALGTCREALDFWRDTAETEFLAETQSLLGQILLRLGDPAAAKRELLRALELAEHSHLLTYQHAAHLHLCEIYEQQGDHKAALAHLRRANEAERLKETGLNRRQNQLLTALVMVEHFENQVKLTQQRNQELERVNATLEQMRAELQHQATHDPLTNLHNRHAFDATLRETLATGEKLGILLFDLDRFKDVNDTLGHAAGDAVLQEVARRLTPLFRAEDTVARLGGDEFAVLLRGIESESSGLTRGHAVRDALQKPFFIENQRLMLSASVGFAMTPADGEDPVTLLKNADIAMYQAKIERNAVRRYEAAMGQAAQESLAHIQDLMAALERGEFTLHYQPVVESATLRPVALEALLRWRHPRLGLQSAGGFISLLENHDQTRRVGHWVLAQSLAQIAHWQMRYPDLGICINLSPRQLAQPHFASELETLLRRYVVPPHTVTLEITNGVRLSAEAWAEFRPLLDAGLRLALDDFGMVSYSLQDLLQMPTKIIKLDGTLMHDLLREGPAGRGADILRGMLRFTQECQLEVVVEGVEDEAQLQILREWGCECLQGYFLSHPLPAREAGLYLEEHLGQQMP